MSESVVLNFFSLEAEVRKYEERMKLLVESFRRYTTELACEESDKNRHHESSGGSGKSMQTRSSRKCHMERDCVNRSINGSLVITTESKNCVCLSTQRSARISQMRQSQKLPVVKECVTAEGGDPENTFSNQNKTRDARFSFALTVKFSSDGMPGGCNSDSTLVDVCRKPSLVANIDEKENSREVANGGNSVEASKHLGSDDLTERKNPESSLKPKSDASNIDLLKECTVVIQRLSNNHWIFQPKVVLERLTDEEINSFNPRTKFCSSPLTDGRVKFSSLPLDSVRKTPKLSSKVKKSILKSSQTPSLNKVVSKSSAVQITLENPRVLNSLSELEIDSSTRRETNRHATLQTHGILKPPKLIIKTPIRNNFGFKTSPKFRISPSKGWRTTRSKSRVVDHAKIEPSSTCTSSHQILSEPLWKDDARKKPKLLLKLMMKSERS